MEVSTAAKYITTNTVRFRWNNGWRDLDSVFESVRAFVYVKERREEKKTNKETRDGRKGKRDGCQKNSLECA